MTNEELKAAYEAAHTTAYEANVAEEAAYAAYLAARDIYDDARRDANTIQAAYENAVREAVRQDAIATQAAYEDAIDAYDAICDIYNTTDDFADAAFFAVHVAKRARDAAYAAYYEKRN